MMSRLVKALATAGGIGYLPIAPGTGGSLVGLLLWRCWPSRSALILVVAMTLIGVVVSTRMERRLRQHDPSCIVIDEVVGMWLVMAVMGPAVRAWPMAALAFVLFRAFDVVKPPPLKHLARLPGGWGVVGDDLGASAYTCLVLQLIIVAIGNW